VIRVIRKKKKRRKKEEKEKEEKILVKKLYLFPGCITAVKSGQINGAHAAGADVAPLHL
jgi:hypothetical protein